VDHQPARIVVGVAGGVDGGELHPVGVPGTCYLLRVWWGTRVARVALAVAAAAALAALGASPALASAPGPPSGISAAAGDGQATVSFTPPASDGGSTIQGYVVVSSPSGISAEGGASPITVTGLTDGTAYTFTVTTQSTGGPSASSDPSASVTPLAPPALATAPPISGIAEVDDTLFVGTSGWDESPLTFAYQWLDCVPGGGGCSPIPGATGSTYQVDPFDGGSAIEVTVVATNADNEHGTQTSAPTPLVTAQPGAPSLLTAPTAGSEAGAATRDGSAGSWSNNPTSYAYFWASCTPDGNSCTSVGGDQLTYTPTNADAGNVLVLGVVGSNAAGESVTALSEPSLPVSFAPPPAVDITAPVAGADYVPNITGSPPNISTPDTFYTCTAGARTSLVSCTGTVPSGTGMPFGFGSDSMTVTATDSDGQTTSQTVDYTIGGLLTIDVTSPVNGATYVQGTSLTADFSCSPADGGDVRCTASQSPACPANILAENLGPSVVCDGVFGALPSGSALDTTNLGQHTVTFTAFATYDNLVRQPATATVTYTVVAAPPAVSTSELEATGLTQSVSKWKRGGVGMRVSFSLDEAAQVTFSFHRLLTGRKSKGRCITQTRANRHRPACTRSKAAGSLTVSGQDGPNAVAFKGVVGFSKLAPGSYSATITAVASNSTPGPAVTVGTLRFTIVK
jgi:large repetitive protein